MAISATTIWQVDAAATGGDTSNGGGHDPGNANMATDLAATLATGTAPVVTSASYNFITRDNGTYLFVKSGTNWIPGAYPVTSTGSNAATLNASIGAVRLWTNGAFTGLNTTAGCATTASPTGGTWSIDYSQSTAPGITYTDMVIDGTTNTKYTSAGFPVGPNIVGNVIAVTSGTGFTVQWAQVASVSGTTATCDKSLGTLSSTGGHGGLGGALISPGKVVALKVNNNYAFIKAGTYSLSTSANTSGGEIGNGQDTTWQGYNTTRTLGNTDSTLPLFNASANSRTLFAIQGGDSGTVSGIAFSANGKTGCNAVTISGFVGKAIRCTTTGAFTNAFSTTGQNSGFFDCYSTGATTGFTLGNTACLASGCIAVSGTTGFSVGSTGPVVIDCIAANNSGWGFTSPSGTASALMQNCSAYNNTSGNFRFDTNASGTMRNCIAWTTAGSYNYEINSTQYNAILDCAGGGAATADVHSTGSIVSGFIALSANPFTSVSTDFGLNTTAGGGALCRAAGLPGTFTGLSTTTSYPDLGAVQSQAAAAAVPAYFAR